MLVDTTVVTNGVSTFTEEAILEGLYRKAGNRKTIQSTQIGAAEIFFIGIDRTTFIGIIWVVV